MRSKIDHESGTVRITTPHAWAEPGRRLYVLGSAASYDVRYSDWLRLLAPPASASMRRMNNVDVRPAEEALLESLRNGSVHPDLVAEHA